MAPSATHTYRGYQITPCPRDPTCKPGGNWAIRHANPKTGLLWADEDCAHVRTLREAKRRIDEFEALPD